MTDRFLRLVHDSILGGDDEDDDVSHVGAPTSHGGEGGVAGSVEERDARPGRRQLEGKCADVLSDAAKLLTGGDMKAKVLDIAEGNCGKRFLK